MIRRSFIVIALLPWVATAVLWVRSYWTSDAFAVERVHRWQIESACGEFYVNIQSQYPDEFGQDPRTKSAEFDDLGHYEKRIGPDQPFAAR